jgi:hypothetical protein
MSSTPSTTKGKKVNTMPKALGLIPYTTKTETKQNKEVKRQPI